MNSFVTLSMRYIKSLFKEGCACNPMCMWSFGGIIDLLILAISSIFASKLIAGSPFMKPWKQENFVLYVLCR